MRSESIVAQADALDAAEAVLRDQVRRCAPGAVAVTKELLLKTTDQAEDQIGIAARAFADCILSDEGRNGIASFFDKHPPAWARPAGGDT